MELLFKKTTGALWFSEKYLHTECEYNRKEWVIEKEIVTVKNKFLTDFPELNMNLTQEELVAIIFLHQALYGSRLSESCREIGIIEYERNIPQKKRCSYYLRLLIGLANNDTPRLRGFDITAREGFPFKIFIRHFRKGNYFIFLCKVIIEIGEEHDKPPFHHIGNHSLIHKTWIYLFWLTFKFKKYLSGLDYTSLAISRESFENELLESFENWSMKQGEKPKTKKIGVFTLDDVQYWFMPKYHVKYMFKGLKDVKSCLIGFGSLSMMFILLLVASFIIAAVFYGFLGMALFTLALALFMPFYVYSLLNLQYFLKWNKITRKRRKNIKINSENESKLSQTEMILFQNEAEEIEKMTHNNKYYDTYVFLNSPWWIVYPHIGYENLVKIINPLLEKNYAAWKKHKKQSNKK